MKIYLGADHRGFELKNQLKQWLFIQGYEIEDCGNDHLDPEDDYVDFGAAVGHKLQHDPASLGIGICGSGVGISIAANRIKGVRCALSHDVAHIKHARENDHVNMLSLAADNLQLHEAKSIVQTFLSTRTHQQEKYIRRTQKLDQIAQ